MPQQEEVLLRNPVNNVPLEVTSYWYVFNNTNMVALITSAVGKQYEYLIWDLQCFVIIFHYNFWLGKSNCCSVCYV
jgi:hypothetical protein